MRFFSKKILTSLCLAIGVASFALPIEAAVFNVTRFDDPAPSGCDPDDCSLREAVLAANVSGDPSSTINLPAGTYELTITGDDDNGLTGDLDILNHDLTINGDGAASTTVDASALGDRAFDIPSDASAISVVFNNLGITGGNPSAMTIKDGGGIRYDGVSGPDALVIQSCLISGNTAVNGGGVSISGVATINDSSISGNTAANNAGGMQVAGNPITINNSTLSGNAAGGAGGGLTGVFAIINANNSTISGNQAGAEGGGVALAFTALTSRNLTIFNNTAGTIGGGANFGASTLDVENTILAGNIASGSHPNCDDNVGAGTLTSQGYNLFGDLTGCTKAGPATDDQDNVADPGLKSLANYGGPTPTNLLTTDSPALDAGNPAGCFSTSGAELTQDQRGQMRPLGASCDIGAVELGTADIAVTKEVDISSIGIGGVLTYTITVTNNGPNTNFNVQLTDTLPENDAVIFDSATASNLAACSQANGIVSCELGQIDSGDSVTVTLVVTAAEAGTATNTVTVIGTELDDNENNNTDSVDVTITGFGGGCSLGMTAQGNAGATLCFVLALGGAWWIRQRR